MVEIRVEWKVEATICFEYNGWFQGGRRADSFPLEWDDTFHGTESPKNLSQAARFVAFELSHALTYV